MEEKQQGAQASLGEGTGIYPLYDAHWHLWQLGVLHGDHHAGTYQSAAWDAAESYASDDADTRSRVVLIDNSVDAEHPNLKDAIDLKRSIDFLSHPLGVLAQTPGPKDRTFKPIDKPDELFPAGGPVDDLYNDLLKRLSDSTCMQAQQAQRVVPATSANFSAHGTGMAGLIGARPTQIAASVARQTKELPDAVAKALTAESRVMPYAGVDPFCRIVPVSTSFDEDPEQLIRALLYAEIVKADVIVIARDFPDPRVFTSKGQVPASYAPLAGRPKQEALWDALKVLIQNVSLRRPILCAAGNGANETPIYPASLANAKNGIIAVGAVTAEGFRAGYSPVPDVIDVHGPSGDGERFDNQTIAFDRHSAAFDPSVHTDAMLASDGPIANTSYSYRDLVTTDVSGRYGYNGGLFNDAADSGDILDFGAYYTRFSGTSGATAVIGGFLSLAYSAKKFPRPGPGVSGPEIKKMLRAALHSPAGKGAAKAVQTVSVPFVDGASLREIVPFPRWEFAPDVRGGSKTS